MTLYQNYLRAPLSEQPAQVTSTQQKLDILLNFMDPKGKFILDAGCANGALALELVMRGATIMGVDSDIRAIDAARSAFREMSVEGRHTFWVFDLATYQPPQCDVVLFLSVWKHIRYHYGDDIANVVLKRLADCCQVIFFDAGLSGASTDLGATTTPEDVPLLLQVIVPHVELAGTYTDNLNIKRMIWRGWK